MRQSYNFKEDHHKFNSLSPNIINIKITKKL